MNEYKKKAVELYNKFYEVNPADTQLECNKTTKQCALICVDEIIGALKDEFLEIWEVPDYDFWQLVKQEIEKL